MANQASFIRLMRTDERGMALALALMGIVVIGALVAGSFTVGRLELTSGRNAVVTAQATEAAEAGLVAAFNPWDMSWNSLAVGGSSAPVTAQPSNASGPGQGNLRYTQTVTKLFGKVFLVQSVGERLSPSGQVLATRTLSEYARITVPTLNIQAAVTANAEVTVSGNTTRVDGNDGNPTGWNTCPVPAPGTGVYGIQTSSTVTMNGSPDIDGVPSATSQNDANITTGMWNAPFALLAASATVTLPSAGATYSPVPVAAGGVCNRNPVLPARNWGEPLRNPPAGGAVVECITYMPVVYYPGTGTLRLSTGRAQGIILSAGNIDIAGNFEFDGIIMALGSVATHGTGNKVTGAVISGNADINDDDVVAGTPTILYSSCAVQTVLANSAQGRPLTSRSWIQVW
jgi:hypothetical protein